ncbi:GTP-binding protein [endosymbiont of Pachyrhynchus infernalis]|uniref:GTP-binding protein n=1 Tax=endosymbiont of Pachyrhynchus infernalis TaxID=1971488 RepID=UPI000DC70043|nr:GTP-binding protein [endosymbiont of Pachyrhynchus infernalis]BBA84954.1 translation initiation factor IF-2 [endosymbiont of Pachyrhynchus infernalis]
MSKIINNNLIEINKKINFTKLISKLSLKEKDINYIKSIFNIDNIKIINIDLLKNILNKLNYIIIEEFNDNIDKLYITLKKNNNIDYRPPIITLIGHVDSGKTSILDCIELNNSINNEVRGITQYIRSFKVNYSDNKNFIFIDTPGHESFVNIRNNCIKISDIIILVISVDDILKNNIIDKFINEILYTNLTFKLIIIINKIDKINDFNSLKFKFENNYNSIFKNIDINYDILYLSAKYKKNIDLLINNIKSKFNYIDLKFSKENIAYGIVIESYIDKNMGPTAKIIIKDGTINVGDLILFDYFFCKLKLIIDNNNKINSANPLNIVKIFGLPTLSKIGEKIIILNDIKKIKNIISYRNIIKNKNNLYINKYNDFLNKNKYNLNYIIKTNSIGINDAILHSIKEISNNNCNNININILKIETGILKKDDIYLSLNSNSELLLFNVKIDLNLIKLINNFNIKIKSYSIIYDLIDYIKYSIKNILSLEEKSNIEGNANVIKIFNINNSIIIGCKLENGVFRKKNNIKIFRKDILLYDGNILSMKILKKSVNEVNNNTEFGISINKNNILIKEGDKIISFKEINE